MGRRERRQQGRGRQHGHGDLKMVEAECSACGQRWSDRASIEVTAAAIDAEGYIKCECCNERGIADCTQCGAEGTVTARLVM